jgi:general secretion pathway protein E
MNDIQLANLLDMDAVKIDPTWALRIPANLALRRKVLPIACIDNCVHVACRDERDVQTLQAVERYVKHPVTPQAAEPESLERAIQRIFGGPLASRRAVGAPIRASSASLKTAVEPDADDIVALCDELMYAAVIRGASDLHIDPGPNDIRIRLRVDGVLEEYRRLPKAAQHALVSRLKVLCGMDIAERRAPQDGRFTLPAGDGQELDVRTASIPTRHGERLALRFLATKNQHLTLETLGMAADDLRTFESAIDKPHGLILLTGPTGSGKSTTLYAAIRRLIERESLNVLTIENPIEYEIDGVAQVEVDAADKVSFTKALRSVLRHDPDVLMIGEIRDGETADVAIKAALTGHLVFSTLHTNSAANAITRLIDMGVEPYLVGATMRLTVAQRLVRRICPHCRQERELTAEQARAMAASHAAGSLVYEPQGCLYCAGRGFVGRVGLFEMIAIDEDLSRIIAAGEPESEIVSAARQRKASRLVDDALAKLLEGRTTVHEALAAVTVW